ncbi:galactokinase [Fragilaria crotonensis]|nr:galactokinase [Fragilaria crotonensis]
MASVEADDVNDSHGSSRQDDMDIDNDDEIKVEKPGNEDIIAENEPTLEQPQLSAVGVANKNVDDGDKSTNANRIIDQEKVKMETDTEVTKHDESALPMMEMNEDSVDKKSDESDELEDSVMIIDSPNTANGDSHSHLTPLPDDIREDKPILTEGIERVPQEEVTEKGNAVKELEIIPETEDTTHHKSAETSRPTFIVEEESDDDNDEDAFSAFSKRKLETSSSPQKKKQKRIEIKLASKKSKTTKNLKEEPVVVSQLSVYQSEIMPEYIADLQGAAHEAEQELEERLAFYAETHEDQDPRVQAKLKAKHKQDCESELKAIAAEDEMTQKEIYQIVQLQLKEKLASTSQNIERLRARAASDEQRDLQKLLQMYNEKLSSEQAKIQNDMKLLSQRQAQEMHKQMQQHRLNARQRGIPDQMANAEWAQLSQQLQDRNGRLLQEFKIKGDEFKTRCEQEYLQEREKCRKHQEKRRKDMEHSMRKIITRMHQNFKIQQQRYIKRHLQRISKKRNEVLARMNGLPPPAETVNLLKDILSNANDDRKELQSPLPIKSCSIQMSSTEESSEYPAAVRHRHRNAIMSNIPGQLGVEIHNEGLWINPIKEKTEETKQNDVKAVEEDTAQNTEFIPWGVKAREILHTLVCGEIPIGYGSDRFDFGDAVALQGGCIRCIITDFRTGETTASKQRAECVKQHEDEGIQELEAKVSQLSQLMLDANKNVQKAESDERECTTSLDKALKDLTKANKSMSDFRTKYGRYFGPDGLPVKTANPQDQQKLSHASHRYKTNVEAAEQKEKVARHLLAEAKAATLKLQGIEKQAQKAAAAASTILRKRKTLIQDKSKSSKQRLSETADFERASTRVSDIVAAFKMTADRRREQLALKRSNSAKISWVQGLQGVPGPIRKSLWHKMHRRRQQQIDLRPPIDMMLNELKQSMEEKNRNSKVSSSDDKEDSVVRAEQLFLLAAHPVAPPNGTLGTVPPRTTNAPWAEPGWHLVLDVEKEVRKRNILPCPPSFRLMQKIQSETCSTPGRQAASFLRTNHMRALSAPLSAVAQAISLAETSPLIAEKAEYSEGDPLNIPKDVMMSGYQFAGADEQKSQLGQSLQPKPQPAKASTTPKNPLPAAAIPKPQLVRRTSTKGENPVRRRPSKKQQPGEGAPRMVQQLVPPQHAAPGSIPQQQQASKQVVAQNMGQQQQQQPMNVRYAQQATTSPAAMNAQQYNQQFMQQVAPPASNQHVGHGLPPQQLQQAMPSPQHLLPQPPQQYASPQQQAYQQHRQMRLMQEQQRQQLQQQQQQHQTQQQQAQQQQQQQHQTQQQQQQSRQGYPQGQQMQFFPPVMQRQGSFQQRGVPPHSGLQHPSQVRHTSQHGQGEDL